MNNSLGRNIALISALLIGVSTFSTWGSALVTDVLESNETAEVNILGVEGKDGVLILGLTIIAFILLLIKKVPIWIPLIIAIVVLIVGFVDHQSLSETTAELSGEVGSGIYLAIIGSLGIIAGAIVQLIQDRKIKS